MRIDSTEDVEDTAALNELEDDQLGDDEDDEDEASVEEADDEIDPAVAESDAAIVDEVASDVANDSDMPTLTRAEVNLGRFAVTKVSYLLFARTYYLLVTAVTKPCQAHM